MPNGVTLGTWEKKAAVLIALSFFVDPTAGSALGSQQLILFLQFRVLVSHSTLRG